MQSAATGDPARYARWPGVSGCATKMLLGWQCASQHQLTSADSRRALATLGSFAFVGLLEYWAQSVCIFHALFLGASPPDAAELAVTHAGIRRIAAAGGAGRQVARFRYDEHQLHGFVDAHDEAVYRAAKARFRADAKRTDCEINAQTTSDADLMNTTIRV